MSLPHTFFIGRGAAQVPVLYTMLLIGGGGGASTSNGTGGPGGLTMFSVMMKPGTLVQARAGGYGQNNNQYGGGGGYSNVAIPSLGFSAHVGGGGGSGYSDMGGWGGGAGVNGSCGIDYLGLNEATNSSNLQDVNRGSGDGGTQTTAGSGGVNAGGADGSSGAQLSGGVFSDLTTTYPGGGGGGGWYGGGSGSDNNGWGGAPGGGGSGKLTTGTSGYTSIFTTTNHHSVQTYDASAISALNHTMNFTIGTCKFSHPHNYNQSDTYLQNYQQTNVHLYDGIALSGGSGRFAGYSTAGGGARKIANSTAKGGVVVIFKEVETSLTLFKQGTANSFSSSSSGDVTHNFYIP